MVEQTDKGCNDKTCFKRQESLILDEAENLIEIPSVVKTQRSLDSLKLTGHDGILGKNISSRLRTESMHTSPSERDQIVFFLKPNDEDILEHFF